MNVVKRGNEIAFKEFIAESKSDCLSSDWVVWMLDMIEVANRNGYLINPAWLRASGRFLVHPNSGIPADLEPEMYCNKG